MTWARKGNLQVQHCSRATGTTNWAAHCRTPAHQANLARAVDGDADSESSIGEHGNAIRSSQESKRRSMKNWTPFGKISKETELEAIGSDGGNAPGVDPIIKRTDKRSDRVNKSPWFPFKSKLDLVASLICPDYSSAGFSKPCGRRASRPLSRVLQWAEHLQVFTILQVAGRVAPGYEATNG
ncbi:hypothetical protein KEM48_010962 [Puccinia striiformis f. sp. tritici PST-130]|nr:hypothetical protein KEM48_010962 [Puccinia striiformis f. sp. tritici PST-130]